METKVLKIEVPEGYEIDRDKSTFDKIVFKSKEELTYEQIAEKLFDGPCVRICMIDESYIAGVCSASPCTSEKQAKKLLAINKLMNVARYLNGEWKPNWSKNAASADHKFSICINTKGEVDFYICNSHVNTMLVYFDTPDKALQAINILGEETIRLALSTDW